MPPPPDPTFEAWTDAMSAALAGVTLNADSWRGHEIAAAMDAPYGGAVEKNFLEGEEEDGQLGRSFRVRQLLLSARATLEKSHPGEVSALVRGVRALAFLPFSGVSSLLFLEYAAWREGQARDLLALLVAPGAMARLRAKRDALVVECDRLAVAAADNPPR